MQATGTDFSFMQGAETQLVVPYFQRAYVWTEDNWQQMLDTLTSNASSHFLGSIILKEAGRGGNGFYSYSVIDG